MTKQNHDLRSIPSVDLLVSHLDTSTQITASHSLLTTITRDVLSTVRDEFLKGVPIPSLDVLTFRVAAKVNVLRNTKPQRVINAGGVIIQTNIGRSPLSERAKTALWEASSYSDLEYDLTTGTRGSRQNKTSELLTILTGAEDSLVVNNNATALYILLNVLASQKEVLVSRGEAIEIGGGVRIPDILLHSNAKIVEIGTTNRTYTEDYANSINKINTAAILRIHQSNFKIVGFTAKPELRELSNLATANNILLLDDLGSGCLLDTKDFGIPHEPTVQESIAQGADISFFSGDKLIGGPQSGIIVGRKDIIKQLKDHPLARALRLDKTVTAALNATLISYVENRAKEEIPIWKMIALSPDELKTKVSSWASMIGKQAKVVRSKTMIGGGALPDTSLPTWCLVINYDGGAENLSALLRSQPTPIISRIENNLVLIDPRTIEADDEAILVRELSNIFN